MPRAESRVQAVYERMKADIMASVVRPGEVLQEVNLAEKLGLSRTPVREALRMLQSDGLIMIIPNHGAVVTDISFQDILEAYELRGLLEPYAAKIGSQRADPEELDRAELLQRQAPRRPQVPQDRIAFDTADEEFHDFVAKSSGSDLLRQTIRKVRILTRRVFIIVPQERYGQSLDEHLAILKAFRQRDSMMAEALMREHLNRAKGRLLTRGISLSDSVREVRKISGRNRRRGGATD